MAVRKEDKTISPTAFLWAAYYPSCYFYEVPKAREQRLPVGRKAGRFRSLGSLPKAVVGSPGRFPVVGFRAEPTKPDGL